MGDDRVRPSVAINKEIDLRFVLGYTPAEFRESLHLLAHPSQRRCRLPGVLLRDPPRRHELTGRRELLNSHAHTLPSPSAALTQRAGRQVGRVG